MAATTPSEPAVLLAAGAALGEGPAWIDGRLWWVDIDAGRIHRTDPATAADEVLELGEPVSAVVPRRDGGFVAAMRDGIAFFGADDVEQSRLAIEDDVAASRFNDAKCGPGGRLFAGTYVSGARSSALYRIDPDRSVTTVFTGVGTSNGLGWSLDGTRMYYIDTPTRRVDVIDHDPDTGDVENRRPLVELDPDEAGRPDGMCVDAEGCLWVAFWEGWRLRRFDPDGVPMVDVELPVAKVTSCAFGGDDLDRLFVTTASAGLSASDRRAQPFAGDVFHVDPGVRGRALVPFAG